MHAFLLFHYSQASGLLKAAIFTLWNWVCITIRGYIGLDDPEHITDIQEVFPNFMV